VNVGRPEVANEIREVTGSNLTQPTDHPMECHGPPYSLQTSLGRLLWNRPLLLPNHYLLTIRKVFTTPRRIAEPQHQSI